MAKKESSGKTHWLQSPNKNYLGHWDLPESGELVVTIESAQWEKVKNPITNKTDAKRVVRFTDEGVKPLICNQTNAQSIVRSTGVKFMEDSGGQSVCLFIGTHKDRVSKEDVDCIRIKSKATIKKDDVMELFLEKEDKIPANELEAVNVAINSGSPDRLNKCYTYLTKL